VEINNPPPTASPVIFKVPAEKFSLAYVVRAVVTPVSVRLRPKLTLFPSILSVAPGGITTLFATIALPPTVFTVTPVIISTLSVDVGTVFVFQVDAVFQFPELTAVSTF
jgi:hypothetical protein